jgi:S1-C subfamily serine protease
MGSRAKTVVGHAVTVALTLLIMKLWVGDRSRPRALPIEQPTTVLDRAEVPTAPAVEIVQNEPPFLGDEQLQPPAPREVPAPTPAAPEDVLEGLDPDERNNIRVYAAANRSVVNITTESEGGGFFGDETSTGSGSGFVIDKVGHILTNFHVIQRADAVRATLYDGSSHTAEVVGADATNDVAVLKIAVAPEKLTPVKFGDSSKVMVGQKILALGNPFGLERTLTSGIISSLDRSMKAKNGRTIKGIIQTDAAINPGNSGGPLLNSRGEVIGMNTAIISQVGQSAGISFAVPINSIRRILRPLIENGRVIRADLGVTRVYATGQGLLVVGMTEGGPAERAGIQGVRVKEERLGGGFIRRFVDTDSADLIVAVDHKRVKTVEELLTEIEKHRPGEVATVTIVRDGKPMDLRVRLGES